MSEDATAAGFLRLMAVVRELRSQCPWDREQTIHSLARHLIEEAYESADAIEGGSSGAIADELGDLLAQMLFIAVIAEEETRFAVAQMLQGAADKLVRRHPHVYGGVRAESVEQVVENWDRMKAQEARSAGTASALESVARALPALMRAEKLGSRARQAGMDWADIHAVLVKVREELEEVEGALARNDTDDAAAELGDMLLALANAPRFIGHNAEETLRRSCDKFMMRFAAVEQLAAARGIDLKSLTPAAVEALWQEAKRAAPSGKS